MELGMGSIYTKCPKKCISLRTCKTSQELSPDDLQIYILSSNKRRCSEKFITQRRRQIDRLIVIIFEELNSLFIYIRIMRTLAVFNSLNFSSSSIPHLLLSPASFLPVNYPTKTLVADQEKKKFKNQNLTSLLSYRPRFLIPHSQKQPENVSQ